MLFYRFYGEEDNLDMNQLNHDKPLSQETHEMVTLSIQNHSRKH